MKSKKFIGVIAVLAVISLVFAGSAAAASLTNPDEFWILSNSDDSSNGTGTLEEASNGVIIITDTEDDAADAAPQKRIIVTGTTADVSNIMMESDADSKVNSSSNSSAIKSMKSSVGTGLSSFQTTNSLGTTVATLNNTYTYYPPFSVSTLNRYGIIIPTVSLLYRLDNDNTAAFQKLGTTVATLNNTYVLAPITLKGLTSYAKATENVADLNNYLVNLNNLSTKKNSSLQADLTTMMENLKNTSSVNSDIKTVNDADTTVATLDATKVGQFNPFPGDEF